MREIKFRAWDVKRKSMFPVQHLEFNKISGALTFLYGVDIHHKDSDYAGDVTFGGYAGKLTGTPAELRFKLMQYTGLHDRNGKEIYEGDIVHLHYNRFGKKVVEWRDGHYPIREYRLDKAEVIGNIYEHPHLLEP